MTRRRGEGFKCIHGVLLVLLPSPRQVWTSPLPRVRVRESVSFCPSQGAVKEKSDVKKRRMRRPASARPRHHARPLSHSQLSLLGSFPRGSAGPDRTQVPCPHSAHTARGAWNTTGNREWPMRTGKEKGEIGRKPNPQRLQQLAAALCLPQLDSSWCRNDTAPGGLGGCAGTLALCWWVLGRFLGRDRELELSPPTRGACAFDGPLKAEITIPSTSSISSGSRRGPRKVAADFAT